MKKILAVLAFTLASASVASAQQSAAPTAPVVSQADRAAYEAAFQESLVKPVDPPTLVR